MNTPEAKPILHNIDLVRAGATVHDKIAKEKLKYGYLAAAALGGFGNYIGFTNRLIWEAAESTYQDSLLVSMAVALLFIAGGVIGGLKFAKDSFQNKRKAHQLRNIANHIQILNTDLDLISDNLHVDVAKQALQNYMDVQGATKIDRAKK